MNRQAVGYRHAGPHEAPPCGRKAVELAVSSLVREHGEVAALYHLDDARAVALRLADEATGRGQHHTAAALTRSADLLRQQARYLTDEFDAGHP